MSLQPYLFRSGRLGFRNWTDADIPGMTAINTDPEVMRYFPSVVTTEETAAFVCRMQQRFHDTGYCYFATDDLSTGELIGFIGITDQTYAAPFTPCVDIGWRLRRDAWGKGFATEGARHCLEYAFRERGLARVIAVAPLINEPSVNVMKKAGMQFKGTFRHPALTACERLVDCVYYEALPAHLPLTENQGSGLTS